MTPTLVSNPDEVFVTAAGPDIPTLRKKGREKKGLGVAWSGASPSAGVQLARVPVGAAYGGPLGLGRVAARVAQGLGQNSALGDVLSTKWGGWVILSGFLSVASAAGLLGTVLAGSPGARGAILGRIASLFSLGSGAGATEELGAPATTLKSRQPGNDSLAGVAQANENSLSFAEGARNRAGGGSGAEARPAAAVTSGAAPVATQVWAGPTATPLLARPAAPSGGEPVLEPVRLNGSGGIVSGARLGMRDALGMVSAGAMRRPPSQAPAGKAKTFPRPMTPSPASPMSETTVRSSKTMGALKWSRLSSLQGKRGRTDESASRYATNAFEQLRSDGGFLESAAGPTFAPGLSVVVPPGTGAPDAFAGGTQLNDGEVAPPDPGPVRNVTPYQPQIDQARNITGAARQQYAMGMAMILIGTIMLGLAAALMSTSPMLAQTLMTTGMTLMMQGMQALAMAQNLGNQAEQLGRNVVEQRDGQREQGEIVQDCARLGGKGVACNPKEVGHIKGEVGVNSRTTGLGEETFDVNAKGVTTGASGSVNGLPPVRAARPR